MSFIILSLLFIGYSNNKDNNETQSNTDKVNSKNNTNKISSIDITNLNTDHIQGLNLFKYNINISCRLHPFIILLPHILG